MNAMIRNIFNDVWFWFVRVWVWFDRNTCNVVNGGCTCVTW